ncbi:hypothetical protein MOW14_14970 (plasmid) [Acinetobacter indicus]|uniref:hypothetical protein n=1 Tax=Acinetobacter indicus TaxID=756892 RepID=UPI001FA7D93D|nr:hypothetical protein [Acinetobacter indicus]UNW11131.1 hypothetical protein MOW14_14970 [Acinetobacter indicus]
MELVLQTPSQKMDQLMARVKPLMRTALIVLAVLAVGTAMMMLAYAAQAGATEFDASATKVEAWIKGNLGKTIVLGGLIISLAVFAWTRDFKTLFLPLIGAVVLGVVIGIINSSFTAII